MFHQSRYTDDSVFNLQPDVLTVYNNRWFGFDGLNLNLQKVVASSSDHTLEGTRMLTSDDVRAVFRDKSLTALFPLGIFSIMNEPFRLMSCNIDTVLDEWFVSVCASENTSGEVSSISFRVHYPVRIGVRVDIDFYGQDIDLFLAHVGKHLEELSTYNITSEIQLFLHFPICIPTRNVERVFKERFDFLDVNLKSRGYDYAYLGNYTRFVKHTKKMLENMGSKTSKL